MSSRIDRIVHTIKPGPLQWRPSDQARPLNAHSPQARPLSCWATVLGTS
jgi:hypothetical protein